MSTVINTVTIPLALSAKVEEHYDSNADGVDDPKTWYETTIMFGAYPIFTHRTDQYHEFHEQYVEDAVTFWVTEIGASL